MKDTAQSPGRDRPGISGISRGPLAIIFFITLQAGLLNLFRGAGGKNPSPGDLGPGAASDVEHIRVQLGQIQESLHTQEQKMIGLTARIQKLEQVIESGTVSRNSPAVDIDSPDLDRLREGEQYPKGDPTKTRYKKDFWKKVP